MEKNKIVFIGGGGHCKSVLDTAIHTNAFSEIVITDYDLPVGSTVLECRVVGTDDMLPLLFQYGIRKAFITVGSIESTEKRRKIFQNAENVGFMFPTIIDLTAAIASGVAIGKGVFIGKNAVVNSDAEIEDFAIINTGCIVEHDSKVGAFSHLSVGAVVCGGVIIQDNVFVGANATVIQGVNIGRNSVIGAGSVILRDVPANSRIVGVW